MHYMLSNSQFKLGADQNHSILTHREVLMILTGRKKADTIEYDHLDPKRADPQAGKECTHANTPHHSIFWKFWARSSSSAAF